jgi:hypothetical protein
MSYHKKYLKYKQKYLQLKKKLNDQKLIIQLGGLRIVKTIGNTGERDRMELQCFWISILDYLNHHGHPSLTLRELRTEAGLNTNTEHTMFDIDYLVGPKLDRQPIFFNAAMQVAEIYDLRIQIYTAHRDGQVEITTPRGLIGDGSNLVEIAQFGIGHFELIDEIYGGEFIPAILVKGKLTKDIDDPIKKNIYIEISENQGLLKILKDQSKVNSLIYDNELKIKEDLISSSDLSSDQKAIFITYYDEFLNKLVTEINLVEQKISKLEEEISSLTVIITEYEKKL